MDYVLSPDQELQVAEIARQQDRTCDHCGSSDLVVGDVPVKVTAFTHRMRTALYCKNGCGHWYPVVVVFKDNGAGEMVPA
jgi:hypothetical protein